MSEAMGPRPNAAKYEAEARKQIAERQAAGALPLPLTPPDCDVSSFAGPILNVTRLKGSEFWLRADPQVSRAAIELWMFAWRQVPAASLPADPATLSKVCGLTARRVRDMLNGDFRHTALHGFVACEDGRLYHPVLAGDALRAWKTRQSREAAAAARHQKEYLSRATGSAFKRVPGSGRGHYGTLGDNGD
jgi:hypothetical protein